MFLMQPHEESGAAADTGSATHAAVAYFHQHEREIVAAVEAMHARKSEYPLADLNEAAKLFLAYTEDPRNHGEVELVEYSVAFNIRPAPEDKTQAPITIVGRIDQVRAVGNKRYKVYDVKTSKREGIDVMGESMYQMAAYSVGATIALREKYKDDTIVVDPGALIMPRQYFRRGISPGSAPPGIFWNYAFKLVHCDAVLRGLAVTVAAIRNGDFWPNGGDYCRWCTYRGIDECIPALIEVGVKLRDAKAQENG